MGKTKDMAIELANKEIELQLIKEDFIGTDYILDCAIEKAFRRVYNTDVLENVIVTHIGNKTYTHDKYGERDFNEDKAMAEKSEDGTVIRTIKLTRVDNG